MHSQATYLLALQAIPRVGSWTAVRASRAFPSPEALFAASEDELVAVLGRRFAKPFVEFDRQEWADLVARANAEVDRHIKHGIGVVAIDDDGYPPLMRIAPTHAAVLYVRGDAAALRSSHAVAVVGTREPTSIGITVARRMASALAGAGFTVVSGLAKGIDAAAHEGALEAEGRTIAVMGSAIDRIYPASHRGLAAQIESSGGALISEYPMGFATTGRHFVERDRLQAAMSIGVIAVQTGVTGGTLHTIKFAREARRLLIAPRPVASEAHHPAYGGIQDMISANDVIVVDGVEDYPRLIEQLQSHREALLAGRPGDLPPAPVGGQATLDL